MPNAPDKSLLTAMTDAIPGMIAYWDKELCCRFANKAYAAWHGQQPGDIIGRSLQSVLGEFLGRRDLS